MLIDYGICYANIMHNKLPAPKHKLIGHRGIAGLRPENTYCSFFLAAELGLNWIEFDVFLTKDQKWVVIHDDDLARTTNGYGLVRQRTLDEISELEAGLWFNPPYPSQKIPTLVGTLEMAHKLQLVCNIEIKGAEVNPELHAKLMCQLLTQHATLANNHVLISSFSLPCLIEVRTINPTIPLGYLVESFSSDTIAITKRYNFNSINCDAEKFSLELLKTAIDAQIPVFLYTVNDPVVAKFWLDNGVSGLFTDRADLLMQI